MEVFIKLLLYMYFLIIVWIFWGKKFLPKYMLDIVMKYLIHLPKLQIFIQNFSWKIL